MSENKNPWKTLKSKQIYENDWIVLTEHQVINPNGNKGIYGKISFKNTAIGIIPLDENKDTWLVGQYRYTLNEYSWEIPMGGGALSIDPLVSAKRELLEETGLIANNWTRILKIHTSNSVTDEEGIVFLAEDLLQSTPEFDDTEKIDIIKLPFQKAYEMVLDNKITDSISIAGILKLGKMLGL
jgi:8-oxo-dGTP pyrophosphatase MutT (NUDIX family)